MELEIEIDGVMKRITDVSPYRDICTHIEAELKRIFAGFDPNKPERLLPLQSQLVEYHNRYREAKEIIERWDDANRANENILEAWKLYGEIVDGKVES